VFNSPAHFQYGDFEINVAAGSEDSLIAEFRPPWNGKYRNQPISEEAEREEAEESETEAGAGGTGGMQPPPVASGPTGPPFSVQLGPTYYHKGFLNPGVEASKYLGKDGDHCPSSGNLRQQAG
jgi:hypothetical protein